MHCNHSERQTCMGKRKKKSEQLQGFGVEEHDGTLSIKTMSFNSLCRAAGREVRASDSKATTSHRNVYAYKERTEQVLEIQWRKQLIG